MGGWQNLRSERITASQQVNNGRTVRVAYLHAVSSAPGSIRLFQGESNAGELILELDTVAGAQTFGWDKAAFYFPEHSPNNAAEQFQSQPDNDKRNVQFGGCFVELTNVDSLTLIYI